MITRLASEILAAEMAEVRGKAATIAVGGQLSMEASGRLLATAQATLAS